MLERTILHCVLLYAGVLSNTLLYSERLAAVPSFAERCTAAERFRLRLKRFDHLAHVYFPVGGGPP